MESKYDPKITRIRYNKVYYRKLKNTGVVVSSILDTCDFKELWPDIYKRFIINQELKKYVKTI